MTAVTPCVRSSARLIDSAIRSRLSSSAIFCRWLPGWKFSRSSPSCSQRRISSKKAVRDFSSASRSGCPRFIRYESCGRICAGAYPSSSHALRKAAICSARSGAATHCRWFLVKSAKAVAPIACALAGAFSTPPEALTCAPKYFICRVNRFKFPTNVNIL